ncbi:choloylglycine hydrolase [Clostridium weizhouense]|uniref:choloylglycine hydrolase n=1 Tax=Clostridium weizhouense TaxID=2859781 RepID=A0ABS7ASU4_9CLOT|nr:choloylglycine hydrolase [Clostridium weizhouense]MBW6410535.1 choloylglycine hydrolase [Clostridium weizhouense]
MCTSVTLETKDKHHLLGRTMDFAMDFNQSINIIPRNYKWTNIINKKVLKTKYGMVGMSVVIDKNPILADGVNEKGLMCATLYLPGFAEYSNIRLEEKNGIAPHDFVLWVLSNFKTLEELKNALSNIEIIDTELSLLKLTPPLHWIVSDKTGKSIVIERTKNGIEVFNNPIGVMTNSPDFQWHLTNLRQYIGLRAKQFSPVTWSDIDLSAFSQGSGTFGLPGDFTPPSRFVRAAYLKSNLTQIDDELQGVSGVFHILSNCEVPKGTVVTLENTEDISIYTSAMCSESCTYYYHTYDNSQVSAIHLLNENLDMLEIKNYPFRREQIINNEN